MKDYQGKFHCDWKAGRWGGNIWRTLWNTKGHGLLIDYLISTNIELQQTFWIPSFSKPSWNLEKVRYVQEFCWISPVRCPSVSKVYCLVWEGDILYLQIETWIYVIGAQGRKQYTLLGTPPSWVSSMSLLSLDGAGRRDDWGRGNTLSYEYIWSFWGTVRARD